MASRMAVRDKRNSAQFFNEAYSLYPVSQPVCGSSKHRQGYCRKSLTVKDKRSGAPGEIRIPDPLLRRLLTALIRTRRSERKARENQQLVTNGDKPLSPFSSPLGTRFA